MKGREQILKVHTKKTPLSDDVDLTTIARGTPGFAGADLANLVNEAALIAARQNRKVVTQFDFEIAKDKVMMGVERKSLVITDEEKKNTAFHEAGHALVAAVIPEADPVHKVTIIPRGMALGLTQQLPLDDKHCYSRVYLEAQLAILMGGRIAEEIFMKQVTTGAGNDIERATDMARKMVCEWGMSDLGPLSFGKREEQIFLGREIAQHRDFSEATAIRIDEQVKKLVENGYNRARQIIEQRADALDRIAMALLEREVLDGSEVNLLIEGKTAGRACSRRLQATGRSRSSSRTRAAAFPECSKADRNRRDRHRMAAGKIGRPCDSRFSGLPVRRRRNLDGFRRRYLRRHPTRAGRLRAHGCCGCAPPALHRAAPARSVSGSRIRARADRRDDRGLPAACIASGNIPQRPCFPGSREMLAGLGGRKSTATTKGTPTTRLVLEQFGLIGHFDHVQGTDGFPAKPRAGRAAEIDGSVRCARRRIACWWAIQPPTWKPAGAPE